MPQSIIVENIYKLSLFKKSYTRYYFNTLINKISDTNEQQNITDQ